MGGQEAVSETPAGTADLDARLDGQLAVSAEAFLAELARRAPRSLRRERRDGEFTLAEFQAAYLQERGIQIDRKKALSFLRDEVAAARLTTELISIDGIKTRVWGAA